MKPAGTAETTTAKQRGRLNPRAPTTGRSSEPGRHSALPVGPKPQCIAGPLLHPLGHGEPLRRRLRRADHCAELRHSLCRRDRSKPVPRSVELRLEIGRNPCRDRSSSGSRSVETCAEIGRNPRRDRSGSASRLWCVSTSGTGWVSVSVSGGGGLGTGEHMSRVAPPRDGSADTRMCRGGRCCTLAHTPRRGKPRNHAEQRRQQCPRSHSHVHRHPSPHMGARPPHTTLAG